MKGLPRWRTMKMTVFELPRPPQTDLQNDCNHIREANLCRRMMCPKCSKWMETTGKATRNIAGSKQGPWAKLTCISCKYQSRANGWKCMCLILWHQCTIHSAEHLDGNMRKRSGQGTDNGSQAKQHKEVRHLAVLPMPAPQVKALRVRSRPKETDLLSISSSSTGATGEAAKRTRYALPSVLAKRFPHLAEQSREQ